MTLAPVIPIVCLEYNPKDPNILISGMFSGQVCFWDTRKGSEPVETSPLELSHRYPVHNVLWINSKSGTEFFSASSDGQVVSMKFRSIDVYQLQQRTDFR